MDTITDRRKAEKLQKWGKQIEACFEDTWQLTQHCFQLKYVSVAGAVLFNSYYHDEKQDEWSDKLSEKVLGNLEKLRRLCECCLDEMAMPLAKVLWIRECAIHSLNRCQCCDVASVLFTESGAQVCSVLSILGRAHQLPDENEVKDQFTDQAQDWFENIKNEGGNYYAEDRDYSW